MEKVQEQSLRAALAYSDDIIATLREPFVVLDKTLRVQRANQSFYTTFHVTPAETEHRTLSELGDGQWNVPRLRKALEELANDGREFDHVQVEGHFPVNGKRMMQFNGRRIVFPERHLDLILLAIEDITDRGKAEEQQRMEDVPWRKSEVQYRRLFESARDGILILDGLTGRIIDVNPFMIDLLGFDLPYFLGKELWEIGLLSDKQANLKAFQELQDDGYIRYDHLPLETVDKKQVQIEFVSNSYEAAGQQVIQCNIRDCSERFRLKQAIGASLQEKEVLLKEVHHRVKNNLQVISSLLQLQSEHTQDLASIQMFRESRDRVRSMALVHERLYRSGDFSQVDFTDYIESLALYLFRSHQVDTQRVKLDVDVQQVRLSINTAVPLGLLLNELISNCLKHAFVGREQGQIWIEMHPLEGSNLLLSVRDDGVGIPAGIQIQSAETFGMELIADLVEQLHAQVQIIRDAGTMFLIRFSTDILKPIQRTDH